MPPFFTPYTYIQCPCSDVATTPSAPATRDAPGRPSFAGLAANNSHQHKTLTGSSDAGSGNGADGHDDEDDHAFDPRSPRANYSLYPLEHLLYCEGCHQIRCPRCVAEEIVTYYCPNCLFEVPTSNLKSEGNRCTRSCFQCPICIAPLTVTNLEVSAASSGAHLAVPDAGPGGGGHTSNYLLTCSYCHWSSTEIGIKFDKANGLYGQLAKIRNGGKPRLVPRDKHDRRPDELGAAVAPPPLLPPPPSSSSSSSSSVAVVAADRGLADALPPPRLPTSPDARGLDLETQFANLKQFYQRQLAETSGAGMGGLASLGDHLGFGSPASLTRIMSMYTSGGLAGSGSGGGVGGVGGLGGLGGLGRLDKRAGSRARTMREARDESEGFCVADLDESAALARLHGGGGGGSGGSLGHASGWDATASTAQRTVQLPFVGEAPLHGRARFVDELRPIPFLLRTKRSKRCPVCRHIISKPDAKSTNTRFRIRLVAGSYIPSISIRPLQSGPAAGGSRTSSAAAARPPPTNLLEPWQPVQYILTFKNPIFESVKVTLATPSTTPGRFASKVTVLCPQFEIDSNTDVWDDALRDGAAGPRGSTGDGRSRRTDESGEGGGTGNGRPPNQSGRQAMAGKVWERGRNWVSIVLEVVPPSLNVDRLAPTVADRSPLREDEDVVEIPMFVRVEWETDVGQDGVGVVASGRDRERDRDRDRDAKERRELAYWCVLGIGRIRQE